MKSCIECGERKDLNEFYAHPTNKDGRSGRCRSCYIQDVAKRKTEKGYRVSTEKYREYAKTEREKNPEKRKARKKLQYAVKTGKVEKLPCQQCGNIDSVAHHEDYEKPLDVLWLCRPCHGSIHRK